MLFNYKGFTFKHGDKIIFFIPKPGYKSSSMYQGKIHLKKNDQGNRIISIYVCSDEISYKGNEVSNRFGHKYSWHLPVSSSAPDLIGNTLERQETVIYPYNESLEISNTSTSFILNAFLCKHFPNLKEIFAYKLGIIDNCLVERERDGYVKVINNITGKVTKIKIGRLFNKLVTEFNKKSERKIEINDEIIEKLHNTWISHNKVPKYEILSGKDILKGYTEANYAPISGGSLRSCMTNATAEKLALYIQNPNKINLAVFYNDDNKVIGRSLLWKCDDGKTYHDRIYFSEVWILYNMESIFVDMKVTSAKLGKLKTTIENYNFTQYPYLDTFRYSNLTNNLKILKNYEH